MRSSTTSSQKPQSRSFDTLRSCLDALQRLCGTLYTATEKRRKAQVAARLQGYLSAMSDESLARHGIERSGIPDYIKSRLDS